MTNTPPPLSGGIDHIHVYAPLRSEAAAGYRARDTPKTTSVAFGATGREYLAWRDYLADRNIPTRERDHDKAWSMYVTDPFGNEVEVTSYDHEEIRSARK